MRDHPKRVLEFMDAICTMQDKHFQDLSPPDVVFALSHLIATHHEMFEKQLRSETADNRRRD